ncbi:MAG: hypothetical protein M3Y13_09530, partial [Armatimonadota bacterium]|nr:hypothetical protein [Armatimonadota bacterium]
MLQEFESLPHDGRVQRMVELGRQAAADPDVVALLDEMEKGGFYERFLALHSCFGSRDGSRVVRALSDPSRRMQGLARRLLTVVGSDSDVAAALGSLSPRNLPGVLRRLFKRGRQSAIDAFLASLPADEEERLARLVAFGSAEVVARHEAVFASSAGLPDWNRLARLHPALAVEWLRERADTAESLDLRLIAHANAALPFLADSRPDETLQLVQSLLRHTSLPQLVFAFPRLTQRRPDAVADMVLQSQDGVDAGFERVAHRLSPDRLRALIQQGGLSLGWQYKNRQWPGLFTQFPNYGSRGWFGRVSVDQRRLLYREFSQGWRDGDGCLSPTLVRLLPQDLREMEGRRHLALPTLITRPVQRLPYAQFLPWEEARTFLQPFISHPTPEMRIPAWSGLAGVVRFHRDRLGELLGLVEGRRNEQDPVRGALLAGLADLPPGIWRASHLEVLGVIFRQALDAADLSQATANHIERLLVALFPFHPEWCARSLATVVQERGQMNYGALQYRLSDADVRRLAPALIPVLRSWETREREPQIISLAKGFGKRLEVFDELLDILERLLQSTRNVYVASGALALIAEHRHYRLASLVPALLRKDGSWATISTVYLYLHRHRQELLTPYLGQQIFKGQFSTGKTRFVLPYVDGFHRWTPSQQALFAKTLERVTRDEERDTPAAHHAIRALASMPDVPPVHLIWLAEEHRPRLALRDAALRALGMMDAGQGVATLLDALGDSRDRIAIYALRRALLTMPVERAFEALLAAPLDRVTVAKEVVRLIGDLKVERAFQRLLELDGQDLHR